MPEPEYYAMADGRTLIEYQPELIEIMREELDAFEIHCMLSASEHLFRQGRKPGTDRHDEDAQKWWLGKARDHYMKRKRAECTRERFPENKIEHRFDIVVQRVFGNVIAERDAYIDMIRRRRR